MTRYGAEPEDWQQWIDLGVGKDLLPAVVNPNAKISPTSKLSGIGKVPSRYGQDGKVVGIAKWTAYQAEPTDINRWKAQADYGICVQTRIVRGIDIDVTDKAKSDAIRRATTNLLGPCPVRYRANTGKCLLPFRYVGSLPKRVLMVDGGMIEVLGDGQQFLAEGWHPSGDRYQWNSAELPAMRTLDDAQLDALFAMYEMCFGLEPWKVAREKREGSGAIVGTGTDDVAEWLIANWETHNVDGSGRVDIRCPFDEQHTGDSGLTSTSYFPAGTGGFEQGHFRCMHAHCQGRDDNEFLGAVGWGAAQFADLPAVAKEEQVTPAGVTRDNKGAIYPTANNLVLMCGHAPAIGKILAYDTFRDEMVWAPAGQSPEQWRMFRDIDFIDVRIHLECKGMKPMADKLLRESIRRAAAKREMDTAQVWLGRLQWDGVERVESFCTAGWGWPDSDYSRAVSRYIWTGLAGRVLQPGVQCDMAPILVGAQGAGKTSAIKAMSPSDECYVSVPLDDHDDDTARRLRGKLVGELEELRGLNSRGIEAIKAWITRTTEGWIPKYMEMEAKFQRRLLFFGTTNEDEFLADPTGERRFLPGRCGKIDVAWIKQWRDQLWAEGAARFTVGGVDWEEAERLGMGEHHEYKVTDSWEGAVERWLAEPQLSGLAPRDEPFVRLSDALSGAVNVPVAQHDRGREMRMGKVFKALGWERKRVPHDGKRIWVYTKSAPAG